MGFHRFLGAGQLFVRTILLLLALGLPLAATAQPIAVHDLAVLVDADGIETIASVSAPGAAQRFTPIDGLLSAGYTRKVHWLRFSVQAPAAGPWWLEVMPPFLDDLRLFEPSDSGFAERRSGDRLPFASREEDYRGFIFKLALADSAPHTFYLRLQTTSTSLLTLQLWQPERFHAANNLEYTTIGLSFGFFLLILLLNLALWASSRESLYGWFSLFVGAQLLFFFCFMGLASQYLLPHSPLITDAATGASVLIFLAVSPAFYRRMLHVEPDQRFLFNTYRLLALLPCLLLASLFTGHYTEAARIAQSSAGAAGLLTLYLAIELWRQGRTESRYLLLATALTPLTSVGGALLSLGLISTDLFTDLMHVQRWSPLVVTLSLQIALAVRMQEASKVRRHESQRAAFAERDTLHDLHVHQIELKAQNEELRQTQSELDTSQARYFDFYDMAPVGYCTLAESGLILQANLTAGSMLGLPRSALVQNPFTRFIASFDQDCFYLLRQRVNNTGARQDCELRLLKKDGTTVWAHLDAMAAKDEEGAPVLRLVLTNVSAHKQLQLEREEALIQLKNISNLVPGMVYQYHLRLDGSSHFPYASEAIREIYHVTPQQAFENAAAVFASIHPDDHDAVVISIQQSAADLTPWTHEYRVKFEDGTVHWLLGNSLPQCQADGGTLWHGFITDITQRRKTEVTLAEKAQLLVTVLANSSVGIIFIRERKQVWSNARLCAMFGYSPAEFENQDPSLVYPSLQSEEKFVDAAYPALARDGQFSTSQEMRRKDGSLLWVSLSGTSIDRNNPHAGSIWVLQDISKQRQAEHALVVANDELTFENEEKGKRAAELVVANDELTFQNEEKGKRAVELTTARDEADSANLAKSRFLATMSHEIRTPMNAVLGMAQMLMQSNISEANRLDYAGTIFNSGRTLLALLNDILDLSKIEAGKVDLEFIALEPARLVGETQSLFAQSAHAKGLVIDAHWSGPARSYLGDPNRLRQMLSNLVGNAIKFTKQGSIHIEASEVACTGQSATLEFSVSDSGIGIAKDKQALLFQTFSQADSSTTRNYGGTGLGLSIVRTLAQAMGGQVGVDSQAGVGSRFWFRIQGGLVAGQTLGRQPPAAQGAMTPSADAPITLLKGRVLVIEDNPINQEVIEVLLKQIGLEVALANDGQQALDALMEGEHAQLILTDLQMPVMDGYTAAQRIRQWEAQTNQKRRPIIALSADAYAGVRARCLAAGMDEVLSKPVLLEDMWAVLAEWLPAVPSAPPSAPLPVVLRTLDPEAVIALVNEILPLLAQGKADARDRFKVLQGLVAGTELAPEMAEAGLPLKRFRFDLTLERLRQMASKYEWRITS